MKFLFSVVLLSLLFVAGNVCGQNRVKNVVVILANDHALKVSGCYGNLKIKTPNIDKLANEGILFTHSYCNAPICSASRQSLLTGKYPHATGVNLLFTPFPDEGNTTIAEHLKERNYETAIIGKNHFNNWIWGSLYKNGLPTHGFGLNIEKNEYKQFLQQNPMPEIPLNIKTYNPANGSENIAEWLNTETLPQPVFDEWSEGTFYAKQAINFMEENHDKPFFLWLAFKEPHHPYYFPIEFSAKYKPEDMPLPSGSPEDDRWIPLRFKNLTDEERRGLIASYYTSTEYLDKNIGLVLDALKNNNLDKNTLVIYLSDNGYLLNEHKRFEKHTMWEEAIHQPMIFKIPGYKKTVNNALVEYVDVVPSILDILNEDAITEAQGKSFLPVLNEKKTSHRDYVFSEYLQDNMAMVANKKWKYIFYTGSRDLNIGYATGYGPSGIVHRLYDLENDKTEGKSLAENDIYKDKLLEMQNIMLKHFMQTHPDAKDCPGDLSVEGKLVWFCEPRDVGATQNLDDVPERVYKNK